VPDDVHLVLGLVVRRRGHAEQCQRTRARNVELFSVVSRLDQDHVRVVIVRYAEDRCLDARQVTRWPNDKSVFRAAFQLGVARLLAGFAII